MHMISRQIKTIFILVVLWLCSSGSDVSCKCVTLDWILWTSGVYSVGSLIFISVVAAIG